MSFRPSARLSVCLCIYLFLSNSPTHLSYIIALETTLKEFSVIGERVPYADALPLLLLARSTHAVTAAADAAVVGVAQCLPPHRCASFLPWNGSGGFYTVACRSNRRHLEKERNQCPIYSASSVTVGWMDGVDNDDLNLCISSQMNSIQVESLMDSRLLHHLRRISNLCLSSDSTSSICVDLKCHGQIDQLVLLIFVSWTISGIIVCNIELNFVQYYRPMYAVSDISLHATSYALITYMCVTSWLWVIY